VVTTARHAIWQWCCHQKGLSLAGFHVDAVETGRGTENAHVSITKKKEIMNAVHKRLSDKYDNDMRRLGELRAQLDTRS